MTADNLDAPSTDLALVPLHPDVIAWDRRAVRIETPLNAGAIVWRKWGSGPPLVLVHGGSGSWSHWIANVGPLSQHFTVWTVDLPGMGDSGWFSDDELTLRPGESSDFFVPLDPQWQPPPIPMPALARRLAQDLDTLFPGEKVFLAGFSFGGMTAANIAASAPHKIARVVLIGSAGFAGRDPKMPPLLTWRFARDADELAALQRVNVARLMIHDEARIDDRAVNIQVTNGQRTLSRKLARRLTSVAALERAGVPLGGIWGRFDAVSGWKVDEIAGTFRRMDPAAPFRVIEDGGHWVAYECADEFNSTLTEMLRTTS
jgi:pimeloyl-ACP methyl ester carboxylesterase